MTPAATGTGVPTALPVASSYPECVHLGGPTGELAICDSCTGRVQLKVMSCGVHGGCLPGPKRSPGVATCRGCRDVAYTACPRVTRVDRKALEAVDGVSAAADARFNPSIFRFKGELLYAYRTGWEGAQIHVATLSENYVPLRAKSLDLWHPRASYGREDPRLFTFGGRLHVSYVGVLGGAGGITTHQMYARLSDDLAVEEVFHPEYAGRQAWEKNWAFFEAQDSLYAVYSVSPHVILKVDGNSAARAYETPYPGPWSGGHLRGGASPLLVGDRYYHWFHGAKQAAGWRIYNAGLYSFRADPPFDVLSYTPDPISWADLRTKPRDVWAAVIFPCGAVLERGRWRVSMGWHDRQCEVWEYDAAHVAKLLRDVVPKPAAT